MIDGCERRQLAFDFDDLDMTTTDVELGTLDEDLDKFRAHPVVQEALSKGVDLRSYANELGKQLRDVETASIGDYIRETKRFARLYREVGSCETVLVRLQTLLKGFQKSLEGIGEEIRTLKNETRSKNDGLSNRRDVGKRLQFFLEHVAVSSEMIDSILDGPIDEQFIDDICSLSAKIEFAAKHGKIRIPTMGAGAMGRAGRDEPTSSPLATIGVNPFDTLAGRDALPQLERLKSRAIARCREFLLQCIEELRRPRANIQAVQAHVLLKHRPLMTFLQHHAPEVASEVRVSYTEAWGRSLQALIRSYHLGLMRYHAAICTRNDLIVMEDGTGARSIFGSAPKRDPSDTHAFALHNRPSVIRTALDAPTPIHVVQAEGKPLTFEEIFRASQRHLIDAAATEHAFCLAFFGPDEGVKVYERVMAKPVSQVRWSRLRSLRKSACCSRRVLQLLESIEDFLYHCFDAVGLLLMIHVVMVQRKAAVEGVTMGGMPSAEAEREVMGATTALTSSEPTADETAAQLRRDRGEVESSDSSKRRGSLPVLDHYFDRVIMLLWPRFKAVLDANLEALQKADPAKLGNVSLQPHSVTLRYAEFAASVLVIHRSLARVGPADDMVRHNMAVLRTEFERLLGRLAARHPQRLVRVAFLYNNFRHCVNVFQSKRVAEEEVKYFDGPLLARSTAPRICRAGVSQVRYRHVRGPGGALRNGRGRHPLPSDARDRHACRE